MLPCRVAVGLSCRAGAELAPKRWGQALQAWTDAVCMSACDLLVLPVLAYSQNHLPGQWQRQRAPMSGGVRPVIPAPSALQLFDSSQSKSAANSLHLSTVSAVLSGPGRWQAGSSRQLAGCEERCHISLHPCSQLTQQKVWVGCALLTPDSPSVPGGQIRGLV